LALAQSLGHYTLSIVLTFGLPIIASVVSQDTLDYTAFYSFSPLFSEQTSPLNFELDKYPLYNLFFDLLRIIKSAPIVVNLSIIVSDSIILFKNAVDSFDLGPFNELNLSPKNFQSN